LYNHVVKVGSTVYISGQVPRSLDGKAMHPGDAAAQIRQVWTNLEIAMKAAGGALSDIVKTTTYVVGAENLPKIREARMSILPEQGRPTSTTVVVAGLADPDFLVEVEAVAELDG
jgi:enamine deaminase RidA (YjgF/YER057c/UK114 family)